MKINDDKKKLVTRCEQLDFQLKKLEKKYENQLRSHRLELQRFKDTQTVAQKSRREQWLDDKTKELTARGVEPEIQKLISQHKEEMENCKRIHQAELLKESDRYVHLTDVLREELEREKQEAIARERELAREKYEKAIRDEQEAFIEQRKKLFADVDEEKYRQADLMNKQRIDLEKYFIVIFIQTKN